MIFENTMLKVKIRKSMMSEIIVVDLTYSDDKSTALSKVFLVLFESAKDI